jgi:hypothetical protein
MSPDSDVYGRLRDIANENVFMTAKDLSNYFSAASLEQPKRAHRFCFECGDTQVHWSTITCKRLAEWKSTVQQGIKEVEDRDRTDYNAVAQKLWLKVNTRPCPKVSVF